MRSASAGPMPSSESRSLALALLRWMIAPAARSPRRRCRLAPAGRRATGHAHLLAVGEQRGEVDASRGRRAGRRHRRGARHRVRGCRRPVGRRQDAAPRRRRGRRRDRASPRPARTPHPAHRDGGSELRCGCRRARQEAPGEHERGRRPQAAGGARDGDRTASPNACARALSPIHPGACRERVVKLAHDEVDELARHDDHARRPRGRRGGSRRSRAPARAPSAPRRCSRRAR